MSKPPQTGAEEGQGTAPTSAVPHMGSHHSPAERLIDSLDIAESDEVLHDSALRDSALRAPK